MIFNPARNDLFTAAENQGAYRNGQQVKVCDSDSLAQTLVGCGFYYDRGAMMRSTLSAVEEFLDTTFTEFVDSVRHHSICVRSVVGNLEPSLSISCHLGILRLAVFLSRKQEDELPMEGAIRYRWRCPVSSRAMVGCMILRSVLPPSIIRPRRFQTAKGWRLVTI